MLQFRILGPLEVERDGTLVSLTAQKQRATLAVLLLNANRVVSVDVLADSLYTGRPPVTAVTQVQRQISDLRKTLGPDAAIETRPPGYVLRLAPHQLDLSDFESRAAEAQERRARGDTAGAVDLLRDALAIWRGPALADLAYESFARAPIERLEEIRLETLQQLLDAELALGRDTTLIAELEGLVAEHPLHERFVAQLMLALYRGGRQADALEAYRRARAGLLDELGLEPTSALRELEQKILRQDPSLETPSAAESGAGSLRCVLAVAVDEAGLDDVIGTAGLLARPPGRELLVARVVSDERALPEAAEALNTRRALLGVPTRGAAFATTNVGEDLLRLTANHGVDLVVLASSCEFSAGRLPAELETLLSRSPADVAFLSPGEPGAGGVFVPFGGGSHDWAAVELGAWVAQSRGSRLVLVGAGADPHRGRPNASRLLADAALAVQRVAGVETLPLLAEPSEEGLVASVADAGFVVIGITERWRHEGVGDSRRALLAARSQPMLVVHRGPRPGGLAPPAASTRFTWTAEPSSYLQAVSTAPT